MKGAKVRVELSKTIHTADAVAKLPQQCC